MKSRRRQISIKKQVSWLKIKTKTQIETWLVILVRSPLNFYSQNSVSIGCVVVEEINREKRDESADKMHRRDISKRIDPPHSHSTASKGKRLKNEENKKHCSPITLASFL